MRITLLTGGKDPHYVLGLTSGLLSNSIEVDLIGSDNMNYEPFLMNSKFRLFNFFENQKYQGPIWKKAFYIIIYYYKLLTYAISTENKILHIQWENKFTYFERTFLILCYKILKKTIIYTAHNINAGERDGNNSIINQFSLRFMYKNINHIIVHTSKMKEQLVNDYKIKNCDVSVIRYGINNIVPNSELSRIQAKNKLKLKSHEKVLLFSGNIAPYKGLLNLISSLNLLIQKDKKYKLIISGRIKKNCRKYWETIEKTIIQNNLLQYIIKKIEFIPDQEIELYFKAADVLILPYNFIFQSGILFLAYTFGLPVIASNVGSLSEDIIEGKTGFIYDNQKPTALADTIRYYFNSELYKNFEENQRNISQWANEKYSWEKIGKKTLGIYNKLI